VASVVAPAKEEEVAEGEAAEPALVGENSEGE
jgi:hypothetical protein